MQSLMLPVEAAVLGPSERAYWRLTEPLWERVGLTPPRIVARPSVFVLPKGSALERSDIEALQGGRWDAFVEGPLNLPSRHLPDIARDVAWGAALGMRFTRELQRTRKRLEHLDHRLMRDIAAARFQMDPEQLRQNLFPLGKPQERVLPGLFWLRDVALIHRILDLMDGKTDLILVEES